MSYSHAATMARAIEILSALPPSKENTSMTILTGGEALYQPEEILEPQRSTGFTEGLAGNIPHPPLHYSAQERSAYFQGHIRGGIERRRRSSKGLDRTA